MTESKRIQNTVESRMEDFFSAERVEREWSIDASRHRYSIYEPRVDVAIGPFATKEGEIIRDQIDEIDEREETFRQLVNMTNDNFESFQSNFDHWSTDEKIVEFDTLEDINSNPRCFLSVEVEANNSGKYMLGNIVNAISLGKVGIIIPCSDESQKAVFRCLEYLEFLREVQKPSFSTECIVVNENQFESVF